MQHPNDQLGFLYYEYGNKIKAQRSTHYCHRKKINRFNHYIPSGTIRDAYTIWL